MQLRKQESVGGTSLPYGCSVCGKQFATSAGLRVHSRSHSVTQAVVPQQLVSQDCKSRPFVCNECGRRFYQWSNLNTHLKLHRATKSYTCEICEQQFVLKNDLVKHLKGHTLEKEMEKIYSSDDKVKCESSSDVVSDKISKGESRSETGSDVICDNSSKCASLSETGSGIICEKYSKCESSSGSSVKCETDSDSTHDKGLKSEFISGNKKVKCETGNENNNENNKVKCETNNNITCVKRLKCKSNSRNKNSNCDSTQNTDCDKLEKFESFNNSCCDKESKCESMKISDCDKNLECEYCEKIFTESDSYKEHLKTHSNSHIVCCLCGKSFKEAQYLSIHMRIHSGKKPYTCPVCEKSFTQLSNYSTHLRIHSGEKPYHCDICNKMFSNSGNRDTHRRTHTGEKPFMCDICGLSFARPNSLKMHHNLHTGDRPYQCDQCEKAFVSSGKLVDHKRTHTGEKPYTCEICGLSFAIVNTFKRHKKIHSGQKPHVCVHCGKRFFRREGLRSHLKTHTGQSSLSSDSQALPTDIDQSTRNTSDEVPVLALPETIGQTSHSAPDVIPMQILNTYPIPPDTLPIPQASYKITKISHWTRHDSMEDQHSKERTDSLDDRTVYKKHIGMDGIVRESSEFREPGDGSMYQDPTDNTIYRNSTDVHDAVYTEPPGHLKPTVVYREHFDSHINKEHTGGSVYAVPVSGKDGIECREREHADVGDTSYSDSGGSAVHDAMYRQRDADRDYSDSIGVHNTLYRQCDVGAHTDYGHNSDVLEDDSRYGYSLKTPIIYGAPACHNREMYGVDLCGNSKTIAGCDSEQLADKYSKLFSVSIPHKMSYSVRTHSGLDFSVENVNVSSDSQVLSKQKEETELRSTSDKIYLPSTTANTSGCFDHYEDQSRTSESNRNCSGYFYQVPSRGSECNASSSCQTSLKHLEPLVSVCLPQNLTSSVLTSDSTSLPHYSFTSVSSAGGVPHDGVQSLQSQSQSDEVTFHTFHQSCDASVSGAYYRESQTFNKYSMNHVMQLTSQALPVLPVIKSMFTAVSSDVVHTEVGKSEHSETGGSDCLKRGNSEARALEATGKYSSELGSTTLESGARNLESGRSSLESSRTLEPLMDDKSKAEQSETHSLDPSELNISEYESVETDNFGSNHSPQNESHHINSYSSVHDLNYHSISTEINSPISDNLSRIDSHVPEDNSFQERNHEREAGVHMSSKPSSYRYQDNEQVDDSDGDICVDEDEEQFMGDKNNAHELLGFEDDKLKSVLHEKKSNFRVHKDCQNDHKKGCDSVDIVSKTVSNIYDSISNSALEDTKKGISRIENCTVDSSRFNVIEKAVESGYRKESLVEVFNEESSDQGNKEAITTPETSDLNPCTPYVTNITAESQEVGSDNIRIVSKRRRVSNDDHMNSVDMHYTNPNNSVSSGLQSNSSTKSAHCGGAILPDSLNSELKDVCESSQYSHISTPESCNSDYVHDNSNNIKSSSVKLFKHSVSCKEDTSVISVHANEVVAMENKLDERTSLKMNLDSDLNTDNGGMSDTSIQTDVCVRNDNENSKCFLSANTNIKFDTESDYVNVGHRLSNILSKRSSRNKYRSFGVPVKVGMGLTSDSLLTEMDVKPDPDSTVCIRDGAVASSTVRNVVKCTVCKAVFLDQDQLDEHFRDNPRHIIKCHVCGKEFSDPQYLKNHARVHTKERPYECEICGKRFAQSGNYVIHMRIHTGDKPYKCPVCNKCFTSSGNRDSHQKIHTGDRPYMCDICGETFSRPGSLKTHRRIHTGERPYRCDLCDKAFVSSGKLKDHRRVHTGEKPYVCEVCGLSFAIVNTFRRHKKIHTGDRPHRCVVCCKSFIRLEGLRNHQKTHRKERPNSVATDAASFDDQSGGLVVMNADARTDSSLADDDGVAVGGNVFDGYSSSVCLLKHQQMVFDSRIEVSQTTGCHAGREIGDVHDRDLCFYENVGSGMNTFVYPHQH